MVVAVKINDTGQVELFEFATEANAREFMSEILQKYGDTIEICYTKDLNKLKQPLN